MKLEMNSALCSAQLSDTSSQLKQIAREATLFCDPYELKHLSFRKAHLSTEMF